MPWKNGNPHLYTTWKSMIGRCYRPRSKQYKDYGGRGIKVCPEWRYDYKRWYADVSPTFKRGLTFDRFPDNDGDYTPTNFRWATHKEQQRNQRRTHRLIIEGKEYLAIDLAERSGLKCDSILIRYHKVPNITLERILSRKKFAPGFKEARPKRIHLYSRGGQFCKRGHEYTPENTGDFRGTRFCKTCDILRSKYGSAKNIPI